MKIVVSTYPFAENDPELLIQLKKSGHEVIINPAKKKFTKEELISVGKDAYAVIAGTELFDESILRELKELKIVARIGVGIDNVDQAYLKNNNIKLSYTPDGPTRSVVELTFGLMLNLCRFITLSDEDVRAGLWQKRTGQLLEGKTLGLIGLGKIGKQISLIAKAFNMKVLAFDPYLDKNFCHEHGIEDSDFDSLLSTADIVSLHVPKTAETTGLIGLKELEKMKKTALLVNTGRGGLIDENALFEILSSSKIAGAALDVYEKEPYNANGEGNLASLKNCLLTAHLGSATKEARIKMERDAISSILAAYENQNHPNFVC